MQKVTPSATENKDHFVIVDAVGVTKSKKTDTRPLERKPSVSLKELMMSVAMGAKDAATLTSLANRLVRLNSQMTDEERIDFKKFVLKTPGTLAENLLNAFDEDYLKDKNQDDVIREAVQPFYDPKVRQYIENMRRVHEQIIDAENPDSVEFAGFDVDQEKAADRAIATFREFINENKDEIVALRIIYDQAYADRPMLIEELKALYEKLTAKNVTVERLWNCYAIKKPEKVKKGVMAKIVDLISLIRYELGFADKLDPFADRVNYNFMQWTLKCNAGNIHFTEEQMKWLRLIKDHIISSLSVEPTDLDYNPFDGMGGQGRFFDLFGEDYATILHQMSVELVA